jgi:hypothetical protein
MASWTSAVSTNCWNSTMGHSGQQRQGGPGGVTENAQALREAFPVAAGRGSRKYRLMFSKCSREARTAVF